MLATGAGYQDAIHIANAAAAIVVGKLGVATASVDEIMMEIGNEDTSMIIVTGGAGFIGANIVKGLNDSGRDDVIVVDNLQKGRKVS